MTESKKTPSGRGSREWQPYPETTSPPEGARAEGREMEFVELLAVTSAVNFFACQARLKPTELYVLNAVMHHTVRYGNSSTRASHGYLAKYTGLAPKTHGAPLKGLAEAGFIEYRQGSPKKSGTGHRHTQSLIRVRIPEGWELFKDGSWVKRFANDEAEDGSKASGGSPFEGRPPGDAAVSEEGDTPLEGLETRDHEGLEIRDPDGLETRDHKGLETRDLKGLETRGTNRGVFNRDHSKRGDLLGETRTDPLLAEPKLGAARAAAPASDTPRPDDAPRSSRPRGPKAPALDSTARTPLREVRHLSDGSEEVARIALASLDRHVSRDGRSRLTVERRDEIFTACRNFIAHDPEIEPEGLHYLLGLWAGDRALENANHLYTHMRRHKRHLERLTAQMDARGRGEDPDEWLKIGIAHGQQKRSKRLAELESQDQSA